MTNQEQKRRVMVLGNRLAKTLPRTRAFLAAWRAIRAGGITLAVKGVTFANRQEALRRLTNYRPAQVKTFLIPEPENPVDPHAIAIMTGIQNGRGLYKVGYIPVNQTAVVRALPQQFVNLKIISGTWSYKGHSKTTYGARVMFPL